MIGADPNNCSGTDCDVTVTVDIIPLNVVVGGESFNGSDAVSATLASPVFALNDYGSTPFATAAGNFPNPPRFIRGPGGVLSQNDAGNQLQLEDATMRAQFNKTGSSTYHLRLNPVLHDAITIVVPDGRGIRCSRTSVACTSGTLISSGGPRGSRTWTPASATSIRRIFRYT